MSDTHATAECIRLDWAIVARITGFCEWRNHPKAVVRHAA